MNCDTMKITIEIPENTIITACIAAVVLTLILTVGTVNYLIRKPASLPEMPLTQQHQGLSNG